MTAPANSLRTIVPLDGDWAYCHQPPLDWDAPPVVPEPREFVCKMPVPGYWDDHLDRLGSKVLDSVACWNPDHRLIAFPSNLHPPDIHLRTLRGIGWYRRGFAVPVEWRQRMVTLKVAAGLQKARVWLNGRFLTEHVGHSAPWEVDLAPALRVGGENQLVLAVTHFGKERSGCDLRASSYSCGIPGPIALEIAGSARIVGCYVRPTDDLRQLAWEVDLAGRLPDGGASDRVNWSVREPGADRPLAAGSVPATSPVVRWVTDTFGMNPWSDHSPQLYRLTVSVADGEQVLDERAQSFGLRRLRRDGQHLRLNGRPIFLRGSTEHHYFPLTCTVPRDVEYHRRAIRRLQAVGFNWLRCHTWVPPEVYLQAADELGMLIQVEPARRFSDREWIEILRAGRVHPSVVIYCTGNEETIDDAKIDWLERCAQLCREHAPDALFNAHEALRMVEYGWKTEAERQAEPGLVREPFVHHPARLQRICGFSDALGSYAREQLSYQSASGDWRTVESRQSLYSVPCLSHEICIHGNYLNLDLEPRYAGTRYGPDLFAAARQYLDRTGLLSNATLYYRHSCAWMRLLRKHAVENARKCIHLAGYDLLGGADTHWHRAGYPCGVLNEFFELKPGESETDVLRYNGESVLLLDCPRCRNLFAGDRLDLPLYISLFSERPARGATLRWCVRDVQGNASQAQELALPAVDHGTVSQLATVEFVAPPLDRPAKRTIAARFTSDESEIANDWDFWVFPRPADRKAVAEAVRTVTALDAESLAQLARGGRILLLGHQPFPALPTSFQMSVTGRAQGNLATVIHDHLVMRGFSHDGWCDWQFYSMLEGGHAVVFDDLPTPFAPIIEVVSSFKIIHRQASLFELRVGDGRLLVAAFHCDPADPATAWLLDAMLGYAESEAFQPRTSLAPEAIARLIQTGAAPAKIVATDMAVDPQVQQPKRPGTRG